MGPGGFINYGNNSVLYKTFLQYNKSEISFSLRKYGVTYTFYMACEDDMNKWMAALRPFVVQDDIWSNYFFSHLLG